jgi:hypothetical protein
MLNEMQERCVSYFLCQFDPHSTRKRTREVVERILLRDYSADRVEEFIDLRMADLQSALVDEFNERHSKGAPLRFKIIDRDAIGSAIEGNSQQASKNEIRFQDALHQLNAAEFEKLGAVVLYEIGCKTVFFTPQSHDQGVDAFGYQEIVRPTPYGTTHHLTWIAQAKHYLSTRVTTGDIRQLVGAKDLIVGKAFSTVCERYRELRLRPCAPTAIALITTDEVPSTVRRLAENSGVYVFAASDLFDVLRKSITSITAKEIRRMLVQRQKLIQTLQ